MDETDINKPLKDTETATKQGIGVGVKVVLTVAVLGAIAAGIFIAVLLAQ